MSALPTIIRSQRHQPKDDAAYSTGIQLQPLGGELRLSRENDDNRAAQLVQRGIDGFPADSSLNMLTPDKHLGYLSTRYSPRLHPLPSVPLLTESNWTTVPLSLIE